MSIQTDILDTIGDGGIEVDALRGKLGNVGANELDCALNALMRARRVKVSSGRYEVIPSIRPIGHMSSTKPPSAEEEAAASLLPATRICVTCQGEPQALHQFRVVGPGEKRAEECNECWRKRARVKRPLLATPRTLADIHVTAPVVIHSARRQESVNGGSGDSKPLGPHTEPLADRLPDGAKPPPTSSANSKSPQREGGNRDVSTEHAQEAAAVPGTPESYSRSDPSEDARTPASAERVSPVFDRVTLQRQSGLNKIALLEVELANARAYVAERERFLADYKRFSAEEKAQ